MDYGKYKFQQQKKEKEAKKKQRANIQHVKEIKFRPKIEKHDYETKVKHIREFLEDNNKVKVIIMFRGRENIHPEIGQQLAERIIEDVKEVGKAEKPPKKEGRNMTFTLVPKKDK